MTRVRGREAGGAGDISRRYRGGCVARATAEVARWGENEKAKRRRSDAVRLWSWDGGVVEQAPWAVQRRPHYSGSALYLLEPCGPFCAPVLCGASLLPLQRFGSLLISLAPIYRSLSLVIAGRRTARGASSVLAKCDAVLMCSSGKDCYQGGSAIWYRARTSGGTCATRYLAISGTLFSLRMYKTQ